MNLVNILAAIIGAAVLERYPNMRIAFGESGIGWIPYALDRMDFEWEDRFRDLGLKMKPRDYWRRQCKATFQFDRIGAKLIDDMGVETLMWGSDYPHPDGVWPESSEVHRGAVRRPAGRGRSTRSPARTPPSSTAWSTDEGRHSRTIDAPTLPRLRRGSRRAALPGEGWAASKDPDPRIARNGYPPLALRERV